MPRYNRPSPIIGEDGSEQYIVEKIMDERFSNGVLQYKIRWKGYPPSDDIWKDAEEIKDNCASVIRKFEESRKRSKSRSLSEHSQDDTAESAQSSSTSVSKRLSARPESPGTIAKSGRGPHSASEREIISCSVVKIESGISDIDADLEGNSVPIVLNSPPSKKAVRPLIDRDKLTILDEKLSDETARSSCASSERSFVDMTPPPDARTLKKMVEDKEVEVCFCDIGKQLRFGFPKGGAVVYVYPDTKFPLEDLQLESISFPYAVIKRLDNKELRILVKLKKQNRHTVVDYSLRKFFTKFENLSMGFLEVINHYRRTQTEISRRIDEFENLVKTGKDIWKNHAYDEAGELLSDEEIIPYLPAEYRSPNDPPTKIVEDFLNDLMDNNERLYFFKLAKEFGKSMSQSSEACAAIKDITDLFEKREKQFKVIKQNCIGQWCEQWTALFTVPSQ